MIFPTITHQGKQYIVDLENKVLRSPIDGTIYSLVDNMENLSYNNRLLVLQAVDAWVQEAYAELEKPIPYKVDMATINYN